MHGAGTAAEQFPLAAHPGRILLPIMRRGLPMITHGHGPALGNIMMREMLTRTTIAPMSMDVCVAHSQGGTRILAVEHRA